MGKRAALYCRLSKEDIEKETEDQDSQSIINQTTMLMDYIKKHGFSLYQIYKDDDYSGLYDDRPGFERLIRDASLGKFDVVVAKSQSRFTRNMEHLEKYIHRDFTSWGIRFIGVVDNVDTDNRGNKKARQINGLVNEWYSEDLSESIKASFRIKEKQGQFIGASPPYGYLKSPEDRHKLIPDEDAANIVKKIFQLYLAGNRKSQIARCLQRKEILVPTIYKRQVLGINYYNAHGPENPYKWSPATIDKILKNEVYIGNMVQNRCIRNSFKDRKKVSLPRELWVKVENTHEAIIDKDTFNSVQTMLTKK